MKIRNGKKGAHPPAKPAKPKGNSQLAGEEERSTAKDEPMGSIAAAVPGSDARAQNAIENAEPPGAEEPQIIAAPETTAGVEFKSGTKPSRARKSRP